MKIEEVSDQLIKQGLDWEMQDLYLYLDGEKGVSKFRKNNQIINHQEFPMEEAQQVISRFKFLGAMDVGEKRKAQLGAISYSLGQMSVRLRLSTVGDYRGYESMVIRFLGTNGHDYCYDRVHQYEALLNDTQKHHGLFLFSGVTGFGKTTLMYHLAKKIGGQVITIEDPVEIEEASFLQLQTNEKIGQTYDQLIKLSLRHRPDLLIIGEIRDSLTAHAAIRAALTGHQVFATIHAKSCQETVVRLVELGCSQWEIDNCLKGIVHQSLPLLDGKILPVIEYQLYKEACL